MRFLTSIHVGTIAALLAGDAPVRHSDAEHSAKPAKNTEAGEVVEVGLASYYANKYHGRLTASGEEFNTHKLTAAHRTLPFGTRVKVTTTESNRSVVVRINDRGPFISGRIIDVSRAAAGELQMIHVGLAKVRVAVVP